MPGGPTHPARSVLLHAGDNAPRELVIVAEPHENLIEDDVIEHANLRHVSQQISDLPRPRAQAVDERLDAGAAETPQRRVHRDSPPTARELRDPVERIALRSG